VSVAPGDGQFASDDLQMADLRSHGCGWGRSPKMEVPIRTRVEPSAMAGS
jgi:hypothetical protein